MPEKIKVGIAGLGRSGWKIHAACLKNKPDRFTVAAVADEKEPYLREAREALGASVFRDYREMIAAGGFDLFVNALPTPFHGPATIEALEAGLHVVCEKPMAPGLQEFDAMAETASAAGKRLFPFQNNRLQPFFDKMQEVIASGVLGEVFHIRSTWGGFRRRWDWQTRQENFGGALYNTGPHAVDQALVLFGEDRDPEVFCRLDCHHRLGGDADDFCALTLFDPQRRAPTIDILIASHLKYPPPYLYTVSGSTGTMVANSEEVRWTYYDPEQAPEPPFWPHWSENREYPHEELDWTEKIWRIEDRDLRHSVGYTLRSLPSGPEKFYNNIHGVLIHGERPLITLAQARRQIAVIEECHRQNPLPRTPDPRGAGS